MDTGLIVRLIVSIVAMVNAMCAILGVPGLEVSESQLYEVVSVLGMLYTWAWGFWKNNNFTHAAKKAQAYLDELKYGNVEE